MRRGINKTKFSLFKTQWLGALLSASVTLHNSSLQAQDSGTNAVVVYNSRVPESKLVAEHYAEKRHVPSSQVFGFELSTNETISRAEFRDDLQLPLARALEKGKLWTIGEHTIPASTNGPARTERRVVSSKIRYAVLCYGVPLKIGGQQNFKEEGLEKLLPELRRDEAAVDSELALLPEVEEKLPLAGFLRNPVFSVTNATWIHPTNGVLMVARLDGPSFEIANSLVDKAVRAEGKGLWGRAYFHLRGATDPTYKLGDDWIRGAAEICRKLGFETVLDEHPGNFPPGMPLSQIALYMGWYEENASGPFLQPEVEFMPGAIAYHLHSFSAATLRSTTRNWVGPLLAKGATCSLGSVFEPFLAGTPDVAILVSRLVFFGFSFGEAAYTSSSVLSWQTTVVGDPLYRPFGRNLDLVGQELEREGSPLVDWYYFRLLDLNLANGMPVTKGIGYLENQPDTKRSAILSEKLGDLEAAAGDNAAAVKTYQHTLELSPTPQQRIRLRLSLGEKLAALGREGDAYEDYEKLLEQAPNYPDKHGIYVQLLELAHKLGKADEIQKYSDLLGIKK